MKAFFRILSASVLVTLLTVISCQKEPSAIAVTGVTLDTSNLEMVEGDEQILTATVSPANADNKIVIWSTSNVAVAKVSDGKVTAVSPGSSVITVKTDDGGKMATCNVTVKAKVYPVTGVSLNKTSLELTEGDTANLSATITPSNATNKNVSWSSSDNSIVTVTDGNVTAIKGGSATVTVKTEDGEKTATCEVTVNAKVYAVEDVTLSSSSIELTEGETETLSATIIPENATNKKVTWSSSDKSVATVTDGKITAVKPGTATITVKTEDGGKTATCKVTVKAKVYAVTGISLNKTSVELKEGETETLSATITPSNATNKNVIWSSSDNSVAKVSNGEITAVKAGTATITAKTEDGGKTATCKVTVIAPVSGISLNESSITINKGENAVLYATITPSNATNKNVTWSSSDKSVATVEDGKVIGINAGSATITVKTEDGGKTATCKVTVLVPVTGVSLDKTSLTLTSGESSTLVATVTPSNASDKSIYWYSENTYVASVDQNGVVKAVGGGTTAIVARTNNGYYTASCSVTVKVPVKGISLEQTNIKLYTKDKVQLSYSFTPWDASNQNVSWSSSNSSVASVNNGVVTAVSEGSATITVKTEDGGHEASCLITVVDDPYSAVDLGLSVKWSAYNYGASSETQAGGHYLWGDVAGNGVMPIYSAPNMSTISGTDYDIVRKKWGGEWRMPTKFEWEELFLQCTWKKTTVNGVDGMKVTGPNGNSIFLPVTGYSIPADGPLGTTKVTASDSGYYFTGTSYGDTYGRFAYVFTFNASGSISSVSYNASFAKMAIRPVR